MVETSLQIDERAARNAATTFVEWVRAEELDGTKLDYERFREVAPHQPSRQDLLLTFGSWNGVRLAGGLGAGGGPAADAGLRDIRAAAKTFRSRVGDRARRVDYENAWFDNPKGLVSPARIRRVLGSRWWAKFCAIGGLSMGRCHAVEAGPELEADIRRVCDGERISEAEYDLRRHALFAGETLASACRIALAYGEREAGGRIRADWSAALDAAGLE